MIRILLAGAAMTLAAGLAQAQTPPAATPPASTQVNPPNAAAPPNPPAPSSTTLPSTGQPAPAATAPPATDTNALAGSPYKTGATIKDAQGQVIGTIARVIKTPDGATTVSASVDGRNVNLPASALTVGADGTVVSSMSKAQISASTKPPA